MTTYRIVPAEHARHLRGARHVVLEVARRDLGYGYVPEWHWDLDDMAEIYVRHPRQAMFVALLEDSVVGTCAIRLGGPSSPPHPAWIAARYADSDTVAQLLRLAVLPGHRRRGLAGRLVAAAWDFVRADARIEHLCLHTNARVRGAEQFWRSTAAREILDARTGQECADPRFETIHFELPLH
ncbi:GNAT family N-acetyltransferase [Agromyces sp. NPDC058136]|uniref:GNAT family N-acetyltransferase n=1 Tax=Agromyces sp. NPDC058136 TaxID=3346354 RepID=UPI0036DE4989